MHAVALELTAYYGCCFSRRWMELTANCPVRCKRRSAPFLAKKTDYDYYRKCSPGRIVSSAKWNEDGATRAKGCEVARWILFPKASKPQEK